MTRRQNADRIAAGLSAFAPETVAFEAGRIMLKRVMGKASFATIQDMSGRIQVYVSVDDTGAEVMEAFKHYDSGDIISVDGGEFITGS